jgi:hypothetical protein
MPGYFSFQKLITPRFVKFIYAVGLLALTGGGIALATWAGFGLRSRTLPTRMGIYYIAIGAGVAIVANLVWRVLCEIWIVLFNIHNLLGVIASETTQAPVERSFISEEHPVEVRQGNVEREQEIGIHGHSGSVLGLT